jgi:hypothetical protein
MLGIYSGSDTVRRIEAIAPDPLTHEAVKSDAFAVAPPVAATSFGKSTGFAGLDIVDRTRADRRVHLPSTMRFQTMKMSCSRDPDRGMERPV